MSASLWLYKRKLSIEISTLLLLFIVFLSFPGIVNAQVYSTGHILFVGHSTGSNTGCNSPGYSSVQAAVDAAHTGNTVYLCGVFTEQVIITKAITLTGERGAAIDAPKPFPTAPLADLPSQFTTDHLFIPEALVIVWGTGARATISGLTIAGVMPTNGGCANNEFGLLVIAGGTAAIDNDHVQDIRDSNPTLYGCQFGNGIQVGREYWPTVDFSNTLVENFVGHTTITNTTVSGYQKTGIVVDGPGSTANIGRDTVNGSNRDTQISPTIAQNGIQVSRGAFAQVHNNLVIGNTSQGRPLPLPAASSFSVVVAIL